MKAEDGGVRKVPPQDGGLQLSSMNKLTNDTQQSYANIEETETRTSHSEQNTVCY